MTDHSKIWITETTVGDPAVTTQGLSMQADAFKSACLSRIPLASETQDGLFPREQYKAGMFKGNIACTSGQTVIIGPVSGLCILEIPYVHARPALYLVSPCYGEIVRIAGTSEFDRFEFSVNEEGLLQVRNPRDYAIQIFIWYQSVGKLRAGA